MIQQQKETVRLPQIMVKNKDLNYAFIVFAVTLTLLFAFVTYYPSENISEAEIETIEQSEPDNVAVTSN